MARKVFLSFLGTSFYEVCTYFDAHHEYTPTRFIQRATLEQIGAQQWTAEDVAYIFITQKAYEDNWDKDRKVRSRYNGAQEVPYRRLEAEMADMQLKCAVEAVGIPSEAGDHEEMWEIFQSVYERLQEGDELYIDLTHAFRYLPMLVLVLSNYAKFLKQIKVQHLSYGNWEARIEKDGQCCAPIIDLLPLTHLQDWTFAAADFIRNGYAGRLNVMTYDTLLPLLKSRTATETPKLVRKLGSNLLKYTEFMQTCRGIELYDGQMLEFLRTNFKKISDTGIKPLNPIFSSLEDVFVGAETGIERCLNAARWCNDKHLYQQSLTILEESIISFFCDRHGLDRMEESDRALITGVFAIACKKLPRANWKVRLENVEFIRGLLADPLLQNDAVQKSVSSLLEFRNNINHAGYNKKGLDVSKISDLIETLSVSLLPHVSDGIGGAVPSYQKKVFINFSNHPFAGWSEAQRRAAEAYGEIIDVPFPQVDAAKDGEAVRSEASAKAKELVNAYYSQGVELTVHAMGEMTYLYAFVSALKSCGIRCLASCSERVVEELGDGKKVVVFQFEGFREY